MLNIKPLMIGTAGHVDHGKTSLVKHLTGFNTDRHKEEQTRGMSIDFGVAPIKLPSGEVAGIIDVPGHEDFIHNMLAGASAIDILMLVVAGDDSVMPQTIEHLKMSCALGIKEVLAVITKCDLVAEDDLLVVEEEVKELCKDCGFFEITVLKVSNVSGEGINEVREKLSQLAEKVKQKHDPRGFRMYLRDIFSVKGHGTVVTGIPSSGEAKPGDTLELNAGERDLTIRGIQSYRAQAPSARAHISSAINLRDVSVEDLHRGMSLTEKGLYEAGNKILVFIKNETPDFIIKKRMFFSFHAWTIFSGIEFHLVGSEELKYKEEGIGIIKFSSNRVFSYGDRFILRFGGNSQMSASGAVICSSPGRVVRKLRGFYLERIKSAFDLAKKGEFERSALICSRYEILTYERARKLFNLHDSELNSLLRTLEDEGELLSLGKSNWLINSKKQEIIRRISRSAESVNNKSKTVLGIKYSQLGKMLGLSDEIISSLVNILKQESEIISEHGYVTLKHLAPRISAREAQLREAVEKRVREAGVSGYAKNTLIQELSMTPEETKHVFKLLEHEEVIIPLGEHYILAKTALEVRSKLLELFKKSEIVTLSDFRKLTGASRNAAVALLEYFDSRGLTKRKGEGRALVSINA